MIPLFHFAAETIALWANGNLPWSKVVIQVCQNEQRCLVTLDLDFSNPLQFNPANYSGIAVLRLPNSLNSQDLLDGIKTLINALKQEEITGKLWIIQKGRIRIYQPED